MKLYLICDNPDTAVGMRLAGIEGVIVKDEVGASDSLNKVVKDENVSVVLMNRSLFSVCENTVKAFRKAHSVPVIIEIPDRQSAGTGSSLADYIRNTVGISI
ncbi:MAG: V-type ATP synthase subunit F [Clostridia bacterium]|nr:V-type ATP synthase subunit F [Clostridia bacterium]